jgi:hypothetical protein
LSPTADSHPGRLAEAAARWPDADHEQLVEYLESDQLVEERSHPLARRTLGPGAVALLWALRVFVIVIGVMVIYTFFANLSS